MHICILYTYLVSTNSVEAIQFPGTRVKYGCEPSCRCWGLKLSLLEEQPVFLITKPSLQLHNCVLK